MTKQLGISLVELMISVLLSSFLVILATQQYLICKRQSFHVHALLEQDFELQLVNDLLRDSVRRAGFTPCLNVNSLNILDQRNGRIGIDAIETNKKHDRLQIRRMNEDFTEVIKPLSQNLLLAKSDLHFEPQQVILIADCYHGEIQQIDYARKTNNGTILKLNHHLAFNYSEPIYLGEWIEESFFVQTNRQGKRALYYRQKHAEELTERIDKISIELTTHQSKTLVNVAWGMDQSETLQISTRVRLG